MNALGTQVILDMKDCDRELLNNLPYIRNVLLSAVRLVGATVVGQTFHQFSPQGVTGVVSIAESHVCIHTWPEYGYAAVDIFTCGDTLKPKDAADYIIDRLHCKDASLQEMKRGVVPQINGHAVIGAAARERK